MDIVTCDCGGEVREVRGPGRTFEYIKGVFVDVPEGTLIPTCIVCGSYHLGVESDELERVLSPLYLAKLEEMRARLEVESTACDAKLRIAFVKAREPRPDISKLTPERVALIESLEVAPITKTRALLLLAHLDTGGIHPECSDSISGGIRLDLRTDSRYVTWFLYPSEMPWPGVHVLRLYTANSGRIESKWFFNAHTLMADLKALQ